MAEYWLLTVWHIEAPLEAVYAAVCEPPSWPAWWPDARRIVQQQSGDADGVGSRYRCSWQGRLPYRLNFDLLTTRMQPPVAVEGTVCGDLEGYGRCQFSQQGAVTTVRHEWRVRTTRPWMNLLAPVVAPLFKRNHAQAMRRAGKGLAQRLDARLLGLEHRDLGAVHEARAAIAAGLVAGTVATLFEIALWWLAAVPLMAALERDTRLVAAIALGPAVLDTPGAVPWSVWLLATLIHFALSCLYGLILARRIDRQPLGRGLLAGGLFGAALYLVNLYGFTLLFPWFAAVRDWITGLTHLIFGVALAASYFALRRRGAAQSSVGPIQG